MTWISVIQTNLPGVYGTKGVFPANIRANFKSKLTTSLIGGGFGMKSHSRSVQVLMTMPNHSLRGVSFFLFYFISKQKERGSLAQDFQEALHPHWSKGAPSGLKVIFLFVYFKQNYNYFCRTQSECLTKSKVGLSGLWFLFLY